MNEIIVDIDNIRIDSYLSKKIDISRNKASKIMNQFLVNGQPVKSSHTLKIGDIITYEDLEEDLMSVEPEKMDLDIVYEDEDLMVINKPNGLVVHPAAGNFNHTLVNGIMYHSKELSSINGEFRPGIVHRIDAYTTGLLVVAKNDKAHNFLADQLSDKTLSRTYLALVWGVIKNDTGTIDAPIGRDLNDRKKMSVTSLNSKEAITHFKVLERYPNATLIEVSLETGRTHQIRVHMNYIGYPIVNDPVYGKRKLINDEGQCLHAYKIAFIHPKTNESMSFSAPIPEKFQEINELIRGE